MDTQTQSYSGVTEKETHTLGNEEQHFGQRAENFVAAAA